MGKRCASECIPLANRFTLKRTASGEDLIKTHHSVFEVVADVAVKEPDSFILGNHIDRSHRHRAEKHRVHPHSVPHYGISMPVSHVNVVFVSVGE